MSQHQKRKVTIHLLVLCEHTARIFFTSQFNLFQGSQLHFTLGNPPNQQPPPHSHSHAHAHHPLPHSHPYSHAHQQVQQVTNPATYMRPPPRPPATSTSETFAQAQVQTESHRIIETSDPKFDSAKPLKSVSLPRECLPAMAKVNIRI